MHTTAALTIAVLTASFATLAPSRANAAPIYTFLNFDVPGPGDSPYTVAAGINNAGQVVGSYYDSSTGLQGSLGVRGFLRDPSSGGYTILGVPTATGGTYPRGVNDAGQVVGSYDSGPGGLQASDTRSFLRDPAGGSYTTLSIPGATSGIFASGINNAGQIVGYYYVGGTNVGSGSNPDRSFLRDPVSGGYTTLSVPTPIGGGYAFATYAADINNAEQIVGSYESSFLQGFLRDPASGGYTTLSVPGTVYGADAFGINDAGQIVGSYDTGNGSTQGFLRDVDGSYVTLTDPAATFATRAYGINNAGQIVGGYYDGTGQHGFIATPVTTAVPEPASLALLGTGLLGLCLAGRRNSAG